MKAGDIDVEGSRQHQEGQRRVVPRDLEPNGRSPANCEPGSGEARLGVHHQRRQTGRQFGVREGWQALPLGQPTSHVSGQVR